MQAEHSRGNGFIISPLSAPLTVTTPKKDSVKSPKTKRESRLRELLSYLISETVGQSTYIRKRIFTAALSTCVAVCCVMGFCNFFTVGTAIYNKDGIVAFSSEQSDYYNALSAAKSYAEEKNVYDMTSDFTVVPAIIRKSSISTSTKLRDKLLLSTPLFSSACTLYSGNTAVFSAESEAVAREVVSDYVSAYAMNGKADVASLLTYKENILPKEQISSKEECSILLSQSGDVPVISVVSSSVQKEIPFETETQQDSTLYIGETVTVSEGKAGAAEIESETVYKNGAPESSRILSENVVAKPVTRIIRVGTRPKDVLQSGLFYPLSGVTSSPFGERWGRNHEGIDIAVPEGTVVKAAEGGTVAFAGDAGTYGKLVKIDHGNGIVTAYAHLSKISVTVGQTVNSETQIALSGNTGRSTGPHLHFEIVKDDTPLNPDLYLKKR